MNAQPILVVSGSAQLFVAVLLGWALAFHDAKGISYRFFKNKKRLLQSHLDDIMMGTLQLAIAATFEMIAPVVVAPLVIGSWINAKIFLILCVTNNAANSWLFFRPLVIVSFSLLTFSYGYLAYLSISQFLL